MKIKIAIGNDHAGFEAKVELIKWLETIGIDVLDMGTNSNASVDYPDYAKKVASAVATKEIEWGILICGSGIGVSIAANKIKGVRAALVFAPIIAKLAREHNNANVICFPARFMSSIVMRESITEWMNAKFEGGRHQTRIEKIDQLPL